MHRLRLPLFLGLMLGMGLTTLAKAQDPTSDLDHYKTVDQDNKNEKAKDKNNDGHRKHWWSLPHFRHKKHDSESQAHPAATNASSKTVAAKPANTTVAAKPVSKSTASTHRVNKTAAATTPKHRTTARTAQGAKASAASNPGRKTVANRSQGKKPLRHNCSPEEAKKGGCQAEKVHIAKGPTKQS